MDVKRNIYETQSLYESKFFSKNYNKSIYYKTVNLFWIGFVIYTLAFTISTTTFINFKVAQGVQLLGLIIFIVAAINLIHFRFESKYLKYTYTFYCFWLVSIIFRGFSLDYTFVKTMLYDAYDGVFIYFAPLILLFPKNLFFYKKIFNVIIILGIFYIIYDIIFLKALLNPDGNDITSQAIVEYFSKTLSIPSGFILLTFLYHSKKRNLFALFLIILTLLFALIRARRALVGMMITMLISACILFFYTNKGKNLKMIVFLIFISFVSLFAFKFFTSNKNNLFSLIVSRGDEDTRTGVEEYFYQDMKPTDWIIGKGINGQFYAPGIDYDLRTYRSGIETDYLNIILKGGIISLGLLLLIAIPAIFKGIFSSKNILSKAAGIWILLWLLDLYPAPVTKFTLNYLLVWVSIGICYSEKIRQIPESHLKHYFLPGNQ